MFFKMLKNDLKAHKGLNIILFIFIVSASIISVMASNLLYATIAGRNNTSEITKVANIRVNCNIGMGSFDEKKEALEEYMKQSDMIIDGEVLEWIGIIGDEVCINGRYVSDEGFPPIRSTHLTTQPKKVNLLYNDEDSPFVVEPGCIAVSIDMADLVGIKRGDKIDITTQMGNIYEFTVSEIYKNPGIVVSEDLVISDADYEALKSEFPFRIVKLYINAKSNSFERRITEELYDNDLVKAYSSWNYTPEIDSDYTIVTVISYFLLAMSIIIILIMLITIRFMMVAAIKQEEKEIGMMRAIGVDSPRYRWMFAATYIVFAIIGGVAGLTAGVKLSKYLIRQFCTNLVMKNHNMTTYISILVSVGIIFLIILFAALMMRRISKISVIETIHGNAAGERFEKLNKMNMYKSKHLKVPSFLAIGNIVNSFKKYIFLVITYAMAIVILFVVFHLKSTLLSAEYSKSFLILRYDFIVYMSGDWASYYYQKGGDTLGAYTVMGEELNAAGIPVKMRYMNSTNAEIIVPDGEEIVAKFLFGDTNNELIPLRKGGKLPIRDNEVIVSYFTAKKQGWKIGDNIKLRLDEYNDDKIGSHTVTKTFIITGFFDKMEEGYPSIIVGEEYTGAVKTELLVTDLYIDAPKSEHPKYIKMMEDFFGEKYVDTMEEERADNFAYITGYIDALKVILSVMIAFILALNTLLYTTVDLARETSSVAMLKCVGFSNKDVRKWQILRMIIILVISYILAIILQNTVVSMAVRKVFETFGSTGFRFIPDPIDRYLIIPFIIFGTVIVALRLCLNKVKNINIWNIRED